MSARSKAKGQALTDQGRHVDLHAGMPWFWSLGEGPPEAVVGVVILVVLARARRDWAD